MLRSAPALLILLVVGQRCLGSKVLVLPFPNGISHFNAMAMIGAELERRGHEVIYLLSSLEPLLAKVTVPNKLIYDVPGYPVNHLINSTVLKIVRTGEELTYSEVVLFYNILYQACDSLLGNQDILARISGADLVFSDNKFAACGPLLQEILHIPHRVDFASWSLNELPLTEPYGAPWPLSYIPQWRFVTATTKMTFFQRTLNVLGYIASKSFFYLIVDRRNDQLKAKYGIRPEVSAKQLTGEADFVLLPIDFALEWARPLPPVFKVIGPPSPAPARKLPPNLEDFLQSSASGVVLVSFGSLIDQLEKFRMDILLGAFRKLDFQFIWKSKKSFPNAPNIKTMDWIPQNDILAHPRTKLFITHAGPNGVYEAAFHAVPMLALPQFGDQHVCAQQVKAAGAGLVLDFMRKSADISVDRIVALIRELTTNTRYKDAVSVISKILRDRSCTPPQEGAYWIERSLRHTRTESGRR